MNSGKPVLIKTTSENFTTWRRMAPELGGIISAMTEGSFVISAQKQRSSTATHRPLKCMGARTVADVSTSPDAYINTMQKKMLYAIGRNINKYHRFLHDEIKKFEGKTDQKTA